MLRTHGLWATAAVCKANGVVERTKFTVSLSMDGSRRPDHERYLTLKTASTFTDRVTNEGDYV